MSVKWKSDFTQTWMNFRMFLKTAHIRKKLYRPCQVDFISKWISYMKHSFYVEGIYGYTKISFLLALYNRRTARVSRPDRSQQNLVESTNWHTDFRVCMCYNRVLDTVPHPPSVPHTMPLQPPSRYFLPYSSSRATRGQISEWLHTPLPAETSLLSQSMRVVLYEHHRIQTSSFQTNFIQKISIFWDITPCSPL
jgi:hypothetical protein